MLLDLGHMLRGEDILEVWEYVRNPKLESIDVPTTEEIIQKP
jgi:hypothetical protein